MKRIILFLFAVGSFWDATTTYMGTYQLLNSDSEVSIIASLIFALIILAFLVSTFDIWKIDNEIGNIFKAILIIAIFYDLYTSWNGNIHILFDGHINDQQYSILIPLTLFMTISPIFGMYLYKNEL